MNNKRLITLVYTQFNENNDSVYESYDNDECQSSVIDDSSELKLKENSVGGVHDKSSSHI